jgi:hypothetical protein
MLSALVAHLRSGGGKVSSEFAVARPEPLKIRSAIETRVYVDHIFGVRKLAKRA